MTIYSHFKVGKLYHNSHADKRYAVMLVLKAYNEVWPYSKLHVHIRLLVLYASGTVEDDYFSVEFWEPMETT